MPRRPDAVSCPVLPASPGRAADADPEPMTDPIDRPPPTPRPLPPSPIRAGPSRPAACAARSWATVASAWSGPRASTSDTRPRAPCRPDQRRTRRSARGGAWAPRRAASSSAGRWPPRRRSASASRRRRRWPSSAPTPSARAPTRPRRSCARCCSAGIGIAALSLALPIAIAIALLLAVVAISYRQVVHAPIRPAAAPTRCRRRTSGACASLIAAVGAAHRLRAHRRGLDLIGERADHLRAPRPRRRGRSVIASSSWSRSSRSPTCEASASRATSSRSRPTSSSASAMLMIGLGAWQIVVQGKGGAVPAHSPRRPGPRGPSPSCCWSCAPSPPAPWPSPAPRPSPPACPPSSRPSRATRPRRSPSWRSCWRSCSSASPSWPSGFGIVPNDEETVIAQVAGHVFGGRVIGFYLFLAFAALILVLAANTSFAAFPRLAAVLAEDGFFPRQFAYRGDRLAYTPASSSSACVAAVLIVAFGGDTHALIPLYAVGVFIDFTISQSGMVRHWLRTRPERLALAPRDQRRRRRHHRGRRRRRDARARRPPSLVVLVIIPVLVGLMSVHPPRVRDGREGAAPAARHAGLRDAGEAQPGHHAGARPLARRSCSRCSSGGHSRTMSVPCTSPRTPRAVCEAARGVGAHAARRAARHRRDALPLARDAVPALPRRHGTDPGGAPSPSSSCPSTCRATGGTAPVQPDRQARRSAPSWDVPTRWWRTCPTRSRAPHGRWRRSRSSSGAGACSAASCTEARSRTAPDGRLPRVREDTAPTASARRPRPQRGAGGRARRRLRLRAGTSRPPSSSPCTWSRWTGATTSMTTSWPSRERASRVLDLAEGIAEREKVTLQHPAAPGPRRRAPRSSTRRSRWGPTRSSSGLPYEGRFGGDFAMDAPSPMSSRTRPARSIVVREPVAASEAREGTEVTRV